LNPDGESRRPAIPRIEWALGSGLGAAAKPLFALVVGPIPILGSRFVDRIGKGLRGAPCDALVADVTPPEIRGRAYGLRQSLDTLGAFAGRLTAVGLSAGFLPASPYLLAGYGRKRNASPISR